MRSLKWLANLRGQFKSRLSDRVFSFRNVSVLAEVGTASYGIVVNYIVASQLQIAFSNASFAGLAESDLVLIFGLVSAVVYLFVVPRLTSRILVLDNERVLELLLQLGIESKIVRNVVFRSYIIYVFMAGWRVFFVEFLTSVVLYFMFSQMGANVVLHITSFMFSTFVAIVIYVPVSCFVGARGVEKWYGDAFRSKLAELS